VEAEKSLPYHKEKKKAFGGHIASICHTGLSNLVNYLVFSEV
jgi:hypothetical protein